MKLILFILSATLALSYGRTPSLIGKSVPLFPLSIIHINDFHARFEETNPNGGPCKSNNKCIGGYARTVTKVKELLNEHKSQNQNPIYLNAGDNFQGTLWYNIGRWNVTQQFLNMLQADAITIGNHEFDNGIKGVVPFLEQLKSPIVVANIDASNEPTFQGKFNKSIVIVRDNRKIGIIGVVLQTYDSIANTEKLKFLNESKAVKLESENLKKNGVDIIIVLSHCGYDVDQIIAKNAGNLIDIIVGSHSHTFLYTGTPPGLDIPGGPYPTEIVQDNGHKVLIVQASAYSKYVGDITLYFNEAGKIVNYQGKPHYLSNDVKQDPEIIEAMQPWKNIIDGEGNKIIGSTLVKLSKSNCGSGECNLGNFFTDAVISHYLNALREDYPYWNSVAIAFINHGSLRVSLEKGNLTYSDLVQMAPFENRVQTFNLSGSVLLEALEYSIETNVILSDLSDYDYDSESFYARNMLQVSGLQIVYDVNKLHGQRVQSVNVRCQACVIPKYEPLILNKIYRVATVSFLAGGGDGFTMIKNAKTDVENGPFDIDAIVSYVEQNSPIMTAIEGRIKVIDF